MSILFSPSGSLNVSADPSELAESGDGINITSGEMTRCKNLRLTQKGIAKTRDGSAKLHETALDQPVWWVEVQGGVRYTFAGQSIYEDETSLASHLANARWAAIQYNPFNDPTPNVFALNGTDRKRIEDSVVQEWGIDAPTVAPELSDGQGFALTGEYNAKYTYVRKVGAVVVAESNPSPAADMSVILSGQSLAAEFTQPTDTQVTHIRLYRSSAGGLVYNYAGEIAVGSTYAYGYTYDWEGEAAYLAGLGYQFTTEDETHDSEDTFTWEERFKELETSDDVSTYSQPFGRIDSNQPDSQLGDLLEEDHDRPPLGSFVFGPAYDGTCFILKDNLLYYCKPKQPEYWPALYFIEVSVPQFPGVTGVFHSGQAYYFTAIEIYYIQGTGQGVFMPLPMKAKTGAQSARGALSVAGKGIYHTGPSGIYLFASGSDIRITEDTLEPIFRGEDANGIPGVSDMSTSWLWAYKNHLYFGYQSAGHQYPTNVLVLNLDNNRLCYFAYDAEISAVATDQANTRFITGGNDGFVRIIESTAYTQDEDEPISWEVQSKDFELQTRKHFPRWMKYDVDASGADTCFGELILEGEVHHIHSITGNRDTRRRLVETGNGNRTAMRITGTGTISIFAVEGE